MNYFGLHFRWCLQNHRFVPFPARKKYFKQYEYMCIQIYKPKKKLSSVNNSQMFTHIFVPSGCLGLVKERDCKLSKTLSMSSESSVCSFSCKKKYFKQYEYICIQSYRPNKVSRMCGIVNDLLPGDIFPLADLQDQLV